MSGYIDPALRDRQRDYLLEAAAAAHAEAKIHEVASQRLVRELGDGSPDDRTRDRRVRHLARSLAAHAAAHLAIELLVEAAVGCGANESALRDRLRR